MLNPLFVATLFYCHSIATFSVANGKQRETDHTRHHKMRGPASAGPHSLVQDCLGPEAVKIRLANTDCRSGRFAVAHAPGQEGDLPLLLDYNSRQAVQDTPQKVVNR